MTSLHVAVSRGDEYLTRCLLEEGCDPNIFEEQLKTPLFFAVSLGIPSIVDLLLDHGARIELADNDGFNALHAALCRNTPDLLERLLQDGGDCNYQDRDGLTLLDHAVKNKKIEAARVLLKYDADPNILDKDGLAPLFPCVEAQDIPFVKLLLEKGADPNAIVGLKQEASVLPSESTTGTSDDNATKPPVQNNITCFTVSQSEEADFNHSAISWAVLRGYEVLLELLLSKCDNITWKDQKYGGSVLHYAVRLGNDRIIGILLKGGPDGLRNSTNGLGGTPLHIAAQLGDMAAASMLVKAGCQIDPRDQFRSTPLTEALFEGHLGIVKLLLDHGADRSIADEFICGEFINGLPVLVHVGAMSALDYPVLVKFPRLSKWLESTEWA